MNNQMLQEQMIEEQAKKLQQQAKIIRVITLSNRLTAQKFIESINDDFFDKIFSFRWYVDGQSEWRIVFNNITQAKPKFLSIAKQARNVENLNIYKNLSSVNFINLTELSLKENLLRNINFLETLSCPLLNKLILSLNFIAQAKSLRKCHFQKLQGISLKQNLLNEVSTNGFFENGNLKWLQMETNFYERVEVQNIGYGFKLKMGSCIQMIEYKRIKQMKTKEQLKNIGRYKEY